MGVAEPESDPSDDEEDACAGYENQHVAGHRCSQCEIDAPGDNALLQRVLQISNVYGDPFARLSAG